jgi:hypothetical protein
MILTYKRQADFEEEGDEEISGEDQQLFARVYVTESISCLFFMVPLIIVKELKPFYYKIYI